MKTLPSEILQHLYTFLDAKDRRALQDTCLDLYLNDTRRVVRAEGHFSTPDIWGEVRSLILRGNVTSVDITCTMLHILDLNGTNVGDITPLQRCTILHTLDLARTSVSDITPLQHCANLHVLYLYCSQVTNIAPLQHCTNLHALSLMDTDVEDITHLQHCIYLHILSLRCTNVSDITPLQHCINLHTLDLSYTEGGGGHHTSTELHPSSHS